MADAHMNTQQLWLPAQNLHKIKSVKFPAGVEKGLLRHPRPRSHQHLKGANGERATFLRNVATDRFLRPQWNDPTPRCLWVAPTGLSRLRGMRGMNL